MFNYKYIVIGGGFSGATIAERIASVLNEKVLVIEKRNHVGGNSYSELDLETGIECHKYGSHIFHTKNIKAWEYIKRFTEFNRYRHKVLTKHDGKVYTIPINLETINKFFNKQFSPYEAKKFIEEKIEKSKVKSPENFEEKAISMLGVELYEAFIRDYSEKQWGVDLKNLPASILNRIPLRFNYLADYFEDSFQGIPVDGYSKLFKNILKHRNIDIRLNTDFFDIRDQIPKTAYLFYTGPIDKFFDYKYGALKWRSLRFEKEIIDEEDFQGTSVMNYSDSDIPYTRIHEFKHFHPERKRNNKSVIYREYPVDWYKGCDEFYPVNTEDDKVMLEKYRIESLEHKRTYFGGRLGEYKYLNMDAAILGALNLFDDFKKEIAK